MLHALPGQPGANNRPPETATAVSASDTVGSANRRSITVATAAITVTASANTPPAASGITGSGSTARNQTVNIDRTASARSANRRNQPRTVSPATQIGRNPPKPEATPRFSSQRRHDHRRRIGAAQ